jgi:hypothetical protein
MIKAQIRMNSNLFFYARTIFSALPKTKNFVPFFSSFNSLFKAVEYWYRYSYDEPFHCFFAFSLEVKPACLPCSLAISASAGV